MQELPGRFVNDMRKILSSGGFVLLLFFLIMMVGGCGQEHVRSDKRQGYYYVVKKGDTLYRIALNNQIDLHQLAELNGVEDTNLIREGTILFIPGTEPVHDIAAAVPDRPPAGDTSRESGTPGSTADAKAASKRQVKAPGSEKEKTPQQPPQVAAIEKKSPAAEPSSQTAPKARAERVRPSREPVIDREIKATGERGGTGQFLWPAKGKVISRFGPQPNGMFYNGIRIEIQKETPVNASMAGQVIFSALLKDYGETVIIKHENNYATVYTHLSKRHVQVDHRVGRGEKIGVIVPYATGTAFFDFEIRHKNKAQDPLLFLS